MNILLVLNSNFSFIFQFENNLGSSWCYFSLIDETIIAGSKRDPKVISTVQSKIQQPFITMKSSFPIDNNPQ